jgi:acetyl esterase/lipase
MMKGLIFIFALALGAGRLNAQTTVWQPAPGHAQMPIWPGAAPDPRPVPGPEYVTNTPGTDGHPGVALVNNVSQPTITVYAPTGKNTGVAALVFPGGGYQVLAMDLEGTEVCAWLNSRGITAVLLKYRVPVKRAGPYGESAPALADAQRALRLVRFHAAEWHIAPRKIGVIGFSAGGHLVAAMSTLFDRRLYTAVDAADQTGARPDFAIACYPGHLWNEDEGKFVLNPHVPVTRRTPPTFIVQDEDDPVDSINNSLVYYMALKQAGVPVEMHLYAQGGHGFGVRPTRRPVTRWPRLAETWLGTIGMLSK